MISLETEKLSKSYNGNRVLQSVTLKHHEGVLGISGSNGSGKSTLLKCLAGLESVTSGSLRWFRNGEALPMKQLTKELGYAAPYISLYRELSVLENLEFLAKASPNRDKDRDRDTGSFGPLLQSLGLYDIHDQLFGSLSTGQQQRAKLAAALFSNPNVLVLDEPGSNMDEKGRLLVEQIVRESRDQGRLVILASNNPGELDLCDRVFSVE